jgi:hypothetical protein
MTEELLRIICEAGCLDFQPLARSGSCNRSLYAVCKLLLGRRVAFQSYETLRSVQFKTVDWIIVSAALELHLLRSPTLYRGEHERWAEHRLEEGERTCMYQAWRSAIQKQRSLEALKENTGLGIHEKHRYKPHRLRYMRSRSTPVPPCDKIDLVMESPQSLRKWFL